MEIVPDDSPVTPTGVVRIVVVPSPSWPRVFHPQHLTIPFSVSAHVCLKPAEIGTFFIDDWVVTRGIYILILEGALFTFPFKLKSDKRKAKPARMMKFRVVIILNLLLDESILVPAPGNFIK